MDVAGIIIAAGTATRMGASKPFCRFRNASLLDAVIGRVHPQVEALMLNVRPEHIASCRSQYGETLSLVLDAFDGTAGPLGGVVAGLQRLPSLDARWLVTFPCDTPFLPLDIVARLIAARRSEDRPVVAVASGRVQALCALWPSACLNLLEVGVAAGALRSVWWALDTLDAVRLDISTEPHAFFNVNTTEDLAEAEKLAAGGGE